LYSAVLRTRYVSEGPAAHRVSARFRPFVPKSPAILLLDPPSSPYSEEGQLGLRVEQV
jgi:hypothetical protein